MKTTVTSLTLTFGRIIGYVKLFLEKKMQMKMYPLGLQSCKTTFTMKISMTASLVLVIGP